MLFFGGWVTYIFCGSFVKCKVNFPAKREGVVRISALRTVEEVENILFRGWQSKFTREGRLARRY